MNVWRPTVEQVQAYQQLMGITQSTEVPLSLLPTVLQSAFPEGWIHVSQQCTCQTRLYANTTYYWHIEERNTRTTSKGRQLQQLIVLFLEQGHVVAQATVVLMKG